MKEHGGRKTMLTIMAVAVAFIGVMGLVGTHYVFGSKFGSAKRLKYGLMLLAVVAAIVGGYFLLKKPEADASADCMPPKDQKDCPPACNGTSTASPYKVCAQCGEDLKCLHNKRREPPPHRDPPPLPPSFNPVPIDPDAMVATRIGPPPSPPG
tara:strand:- start:45 stop:503 length:459 start_codon:yes stop_codon:yes gene_type:complete